MKQTFTDKVILISGGASGIGAQLAVQLAAHGGIVVIADRDKSGATVASDLQAEGMAVTFEQADVAVAAEVKRLFARVSKAHGRLDYVINDAGIFMGGEIRDTPLEDWHTVINNNIFAIMNGSHYAYQTMLTQGHVHIINLGSAAGLSPIPAMGIYGATKYAIVGFTHALRNEAKDFGIRVSVVCPTIVNTPLYDTAMLRGVNRQKALASRGKFQTAEQAARRIIRGIEKNQMTIHTAVSTRFMWWLYRLTPGLYAVLARKTIRSYRQRLRHLDT